jgi:outer membrane receptor protein involved in Fe transport
VTTPTRVPDADFRDFGVFAQDEWQVSPRLRLVAGLRFDAYDVTTRATPGYEIQSLVTGASPAIGPATLPSLSGQSITREAVTGDLGLVYKIDDSWSAVAHYGRSYRHPNLEELLFAGPATIGNIVPNVTVGPEKGHNVDVGLKVRADRFAGSLSYFWNRYDGFISTEIVATLPGNQLLSQALNFADVRIQGVEADLEAPFEAGGARVTVFGSLAYNHGQVLAGRNPLTGASLADTPQDNITPLKVTSGLRVADKRGRFWAQYSNRIQKEVERVAPTLEDSPFLIAQDLFGLQGFSLHRAAAGVDWKTGEYGVGLTLALENLANKYYREHFQFAPGRGRTFTVGLRLRKL